METADALVRVATVADAPELAHAYVWLTAPPGRAPPGWNEMRAEAALRHAILSYQSTVFVAVAPIGLVGFATVYLDIESVRFGRRAWVEDLAVHPEFRSRGIGKRLLTAAKEWARTQGATHLGLESSEARADAHRFYEREAPDARSKSYTWKL
jgi:GNAT superfamily N-acetyltransferase